MNHSDTQTMLLSFLLAFFDEIYLVVPLTFGDGEILLLTMNDLKTVVVGELTALRRAEVTFSPGGCDPKREELLKCDPRLDLNLTVLSLTPGI